MLVRRGVLDGKRMDSGGYDYVMKYSVPTHVISSETDPIRIAERQLCRLEDSADCSREINARGLRSRS